jgi:hypothetical protein
VINGSGETPVSSTNWEYDQFGFHGGKVKNPKKVRIVAERVMKKKKK